MPEQIDAKLRIDATRASLRLDNSRLQRIEAVPGAREIKRFDREQEGQLEISAQEQPPTPQETLKQLPPKDPYATLIEYDSKFLSEMIKLCAQMRAFRMVGGYTH